MRRLLFLFYLLFVLTACGPDVILPPADYYFSITNHSEYSIDLSMSYDITYVDVVEASNKSSHDDRVVTLDPYESVVFIEIHNVKLPYGKSYIRPFFDFIADGNVKVFEKGTTHILAEWKYSERNNSGKQLFSETSLSRQDVIESKTGNHVELEFSITSQDLF